MKRLFLIFPLFIFTFTACTSAESSYIPVAPVQSTLTQSPSAIVTVSPEAVESTVMPDSHVQLVVGLETFSVVRDVMYSETVKNLEIDSENVQVIEGFLVYNDSTGRFIYHNELDVWVPEFTTNIDYTHPELSPYVPMEAYDDGSAALSAQLYMAEHPGLIEPDAPYPHYMVNVENTEGYHISLIPINRNAFSSDQITQITGKTNKPFEYLGLQQTTDAKGNVIYVVVKENWNPAPGKEDRTLPTFHGFDEEAYLHWIKYPLILKFLANDASVIGQLLPIFPAPPGSYAESASEYEYWNEPANPAVRALNGQEAIAIFPQDIRSAIIAMYLKVGENYDAKTNPKSTPLSELPKELSRLILYTGMESWR